MIKILVTGSTGQLGSELKKISKKNNIFNWIFTDRKSFDLSKTTHIEKFLDRVRPSLLINCAAYTNVDKAEYCCELSNLLNYIAVDTISNWSNSNNCKLIHISTDYVYDGELDIPLSEDALTNPINTYGITKLNGENACLANDPNSIVIRTSWLYSTYGKNFVKTMKKMMSKNNFLKIIDDQIGSPTYANDLAKVIIKIITHKEWIPGLYHYSNEGKVSWFEFAKLIKKYFGFNTKLVPVSSDQYLTKARRPKFSLLDKTKIKTTFNIAIPTYEKSLMKCIKILKNEK